MPKIDALFDEILKRGGSDLHLAPGGPALARVGGSLEPLEGSLDGAAIEEHLTELLTPEQRSRLDLAHTVELAVEHKDQARFRASVFRREGGLGAVFRVVPSRARSLADLGCPEVLWRLADRTSGLVLVTGPARSGKSTTLSAILDHVNKTRACHILTVEDPIELVHEPLRAQITQRELGTHVPTVEAALRNAPRENPDVVFVGELRTAEAASLAMRLASSGVTVFASVQARGVVAAIESIIGLFPEIEQPRARSLLSEALAGAVSQILVASGETGGAPARTPVHEVLVTSPAAVTAIHDGKLAQLVALMQQGAAQGMLTLDGSLERLVEAGKLTAEVALGHALDKEAFFRLANKSAS